MNSSQINETIHRWMGKCWHDVDVRWINTPDPMVNTPASYCKKCPDWVLGGFALPDYTSESSPRKLLAEAEKKAVVEFGGAWYWAELVASAMDKEAGMISVATATASQRAIAIFNLISEATRE